eukprot:4321766-Prymnesium_polylepis.1
MGLDGAATRIRVCHKEERGASTEASALCTSTSEPALRADAPLGRPATPAPSRRRQPTARPARTPQGGTTDGEGTSTRVEPGTASAPSAPPAHPVPAREWGRVGHTGEGT